MEKYWKSILSIPASLEQVAVHWHKLLRMLQDATKVDHDDSLFKVILAFYYAVLEAPLLWTCRPIHAIVLRVHR